MRMLMLLRGLPASGKSQFIRDNHLEDYTVSLDNFRLLLASNELRTNGRFTVNQAVNRTMFERLYDIIEERFKIGAFTVIDACNIKISDMQNYIKLAKRYRYRVYCVDFTNVDKDECIRRDALREESRVVGEWKINKMYEILKSSQMPGGVKVISPEDWLKETRYRTEDISQYKKVVHIGDIHGCYTALQNYLRGPLKDDIFYVFLGDFIDRGIENAECVDFVASIANKSNVVLLEGNHEKWMQSYINDEQAASNEFEYNTKVQFDTVGRENIKKKLKIIVSKLRQCFIYKWNGKIVFCNHGGLSRLPSNLSLVNTEQLIKGVGLYRDMVEVDAAFENQNKDKEIYQIHGHRNVEQVPIQVNSRCFNLCEHIEFGGNLRSLELDDQGFHPILTPNPVYKKKDTQKFETVSEMLDALDENDNIKAVQQLGTNISSYNFNRKAFNYGVWDDITTKARGLFINNNTNEIVARGYDKFFNINERPETNIDVLPNTLAYPVKVYKKENGFLGLLGFDKETDTLLFCSKSEIDGRYSNYFRTLLLDVISEDTLYNYMKPHNVTLVFEVVDMENDPHIIKYRKSKVILLDIIENSVYFKSYPYEKVVETAELLGLEYKEQCMIIQNKDEFLAFTKEMFKDDYKWKNHFIEGFVLVDSNNFMFKFKTAYYRYWKQLRGQVERMAKGSKPKIDNPFLRWVSKDKSNYGKDIITLRDEYTKLQKKEQG